MFNRVLTKARAKLSPIVWGGLFLSNWLVNKAKENPKTVQGILGHARVQTVFDLYTDEDLDEMIAAQEKYLDAVGFESGSVQ